ncbi:MAG: Ig-like domain-containing protein [Lautropia sp.]|nr:Ig-like domain-containing protein [Lautropia sp.]
MALVIETLSGHGSTSRVTRTPLKGGTLRLNVRPGDVFRLIDEDSGKAPANAIVKRQDNSMLIEVPGKEGAPGSEVELLSFYSSCSVSSPCHLHLPDGEHGTVDITPGTAPISALSDGSFVLHDPGYTAQPVAATAAGEASITANKPLMYGLGGAAVIGLVAAAAGGGGGGGDGGGDVSVSSSPAPGDNPPVTPPPAGTPGIVDPNLKVTQASVSKAAAPTLAGTGTAGAQISIDIDTNGDGQTDVSYRSTVGADGRWSANLGTLAPTTGTRPAGGFDPADSVRISQTSPAGTSTLPAFKLTADDTPPAAPTLSPVATDNLINATEAATPLSLSGRGEAGSLIKLTWGKDTYETTVGADGAWSVNVPVAAIPANGASSISVTASDYAGNVTAPVTRAITVDKTPPPVPVIQATAGPDNYLNALEKPAGAAVNGTAEAGSSVQVALGTVSQTVTADAAGKWQAVFSAAQLPAADGSYNATATATDKAGNASPASAPAVLTIDTKLPTLDDIKVGSDNVVGSGSSFTVSGEAEGGSRIVVDYIYLQGRTRQVVTHQFTIGGKEGEEVDWTSPSFTAPRVSTAQLHSILVSATDAAGNTVTQPHTVEVRPRFFFRSLETDDTDNASHDVLTSKDLFEADTASLSADVHAAPQGSLSSKSLPDTSAQLLQQGDSAFSAQPLDNLLGQSTQDWQLH